ncbi:hypothetical protein JCM6882_006560 [Rhodosporidiobolus microsporus]
MGGSQLSQLKSKLRDTGLSRTSNPKDPRKRQRQRAKDLSSSSLQHRNAKFQAIHDQLNVFDVRDEKKKFAVVTRKGTEEGGVKGMPGRARAAGIEQRKKTLLPMLEARTHASTFVDHRFGEASSHLTPEEKALERFTAERQSRLNKKTRFNLEDEDGGGGFELTHGGRKLGFGDEDELEDGGWGGGLGEGGNREPLMNRRKMGAEPEEEEPERKKTHAEIMEEVVAKSKAHKAERQRVKSADDVTRLGLDAELKDLRSILAGGGVSRPSKPSSSTAPVASSSKSLAAAADDDEEGDEDEEDDLSGEDEDEDDDEGSDSDEDGSTYELNDAELEAALAASSAKSGVDRDLLRKLIGKAADGESSSGSERSPSPPPAASAAPGERPPPKKETEADDGDPYDLYVRQLALEPRAQATNRLKTPLELAQEAAETLKKQEERRLKRQRGERDDSSDEDEGGEGGKGGKGKKKRAPQGDDLDDGYLQENYGSEADAEDLAERLEGGMEAVRGSERLGGGLEGAGEEDEDEEEGSEEEESGDEEEGSEEEEEDDEMDVGDLDVEDSDSDDADSLSADPEALVAGPSSAPALNASGELPYTFPCPSTHAEFAKLLGSSGVKEEDTITVVKRIRTLYHPGLAEGNKEKLQVFTNVLLDHVIYLCASSSPSAYRTVNSLLPQLLTLTHAYPLSSAPHYTAKLSLMHKNLLRGLSRGPLEPGSKTWPSLPELTLLRLIGTVWSTSDLSHPVAAPAMLLIGEYLTQCRIRSLADLASGLFLATLATQYEQNSKRAVPEALNFVTLALAILLPTSAGSQKSFPSEFPCPDLGAEHVKALKLRTAAESKLAPSGTASLIEALAAAGGKKGKKAATGGAEAEQLKVELVSVALKLVGELRAMQSDSEAVVEMFSPVEKVLKGVKGEKVPKAVKAELDSTLTSLSRTLSLSLSTRRPLSLQSHRAIPLQTYLPKFDEGFNPNRRFDPDSERAEQSKIRQLYRKEKKGAVRELRNDNRFLAQEERRRKEADDVQYEKKIGKIMRGLQNERAEEKAYERTKDKGKRKDKARAGRR